MQPILSRHYYFRARETLLNAVFPPRCAGCPTLGPALFCARCHPRLKPIVAPLCRICGTAFDPASFPAPECADCRDNRYHKSPVYDAARSIWEFQGPVRDAVHALKYAERTTLAEPLGLALAQLIAKDPVLSALNPHYIVPIPLHQWRRWRRGYNQAELLANALASHLNAPVANLLYRRRYAPPQVGLSRAERAANIRGVFALNPSAINSNQLLGARILLVDDVFTTGATIAACAQILKRAKCSEVMAVTVAREV